MRERREAEAWLGDGEKTDEVLLHHVEGETHGTYGKWQLIKLGHRFMEKPKIVS